MGLRASRLRRGEVLVAVGSVLLLVAMFLFAWANSPNPGGQGVINTPIDGWHALTIVRWMMLLTILCGLVLAFVQARMRAPAVPATFSLFTMLLGGLTSIALLVRVLLDPPDGVHFGGLLGLVSACAVAFGGWLSLRDEGIAPEDAPSEIPTVDPHGTRPPA